MGDYIKVRGVDFGNDGATRFVARVRAEKSSVLMVRIDSKSGTLMGSLSVKETNGEWQDVACELRSPITGVHDVFFTFKANDASMLEFDNWQFYTASASINEELRMKSEEFLSGESVAREAAAPIYNLNGQRVAQPSKGLYIVNGKKVIVQ